MTADELWIDRTPAEIADLSETEMLAERFVRGSAPEWIERALTGDVAPRRSHENERWFDQWRRYAGYEARARSAMLEFACECDRPGCTDVVPVTLDDAADRPLLAH